MRIGDCSSDVCSSDLAMLLGRFARGRPVLWCENRTARERSGLPGTIYAPGIAAFGIAPEDLILARTRRDDEALWTAEEALRTPTQIGRASWRERACQVVCVSVFAVSIKKKKKT